jgi:hypothetical protein
VRVDDDLAEIDVRVAVHRHLKYGIAAGQDQYHENEVEEDPLLQGEFDD